MDGVKNIQIHTYIHTYAYVIFFYTHTYIYIYICMYMYTCVCVCRMCAFPDRHWIESHYLGVYHVMLPSNHLQPQRDPVKYLYVVIWGGRKKGGTSI